MGSTLPKAVQAQLDQVNAYEQAISTPAETPVEGNTSDEAATPPVEPTPEPAPEVVAQPAVQPVEAADDSFKAKYEILQGKYNAEVPRLHAATRDMQAQLQEAMAKVDELTRTKSDPPKTEPLVTSSDEQAFGEDLIDCMRRVFREEWTKAAPAAIDSLKAEMLPQLQRVEQVEQRQVMGETERFWGAVRALVPDWDRIDTDPNWIEFLNTSPEFSEDSYRTIATKAVAAGNASKVAALVKTWRGASAPMPTPKPAPNPDLVRQQAPSTTRNSAPPPGERVWTRGEYERAYDPRHLRTLSSDAAAQLQAEADRAVAENRVQW